MNGLRTSYNTVLGYRAGYGGSGALANTTHFNGYNIIIGHEAGYNFTTANFNTALGYQSMSGGTPNSAQSVTAEYNTALGQNTLRSITDGKYNAAAGVGAGYELTSGENNAFFGRDAGYNVTTGDNNVLIGRNAGRSFSPATVTTQSNRVVIGNNDITNSYIKVDWTVGSDQRDKTDIQDITTGLDFVKQLKPKSFWFTKERGSAEKIGDKKYGFLAQDILALEGSDPVIINNEDEDSLKYQGSHLIPILVNAIKELSAKVKALEAG